MPPTNTLTTGSANIIQRTATRDNQKTVRYRQREDGGWDVKTPVDDEFWGFMHSGSEADVQQLIRKKWDYRYTVEPDPFDDRT